MLKVHYFIAHFIPENVVLSGQPLKRDFHIHVVAYTNDTNAYNAAMHNSNNTVIITQYFTQLFA